MEATQTRFDWSRLARHTDLFAAGAVLAVLLVMILPIPAWAMDIFLATNIAISISILLVAVYAERPLDFSVFPTVLLFGTLFRLSLNVASTRLVLLNGSDGTAAAGHIIETFGNFVVGGSYVVGVVVFILLIVINFVVITKGSGRVAEVAARFVLDSMPGKQMSIDADLNAGLITEEQARERRKKIEAEADFYGAMDGASKFVRGDAIAGILITIISIVGGFAIGVFQKGMAMFQAAEVYTLLTIGDGLVTQIPSLVVSTAAGIIVTRAASGGNLSKEVARQVFLQPRAITVTSGILLLLGLIPGIPGMPFFLLSAITFFIAYSVKQYQANESSRKKLEAKRVEEAGGAETHVPPELDILELQVGYGLVTLVEGDKKGELVDRIYQLRKEYAREMGIIVPKVRIKDNLELQAGGYAILVKGIAVGEGELIAGYLMAMDPGNVRNPISGIETKEPVFGLSAMWIPEKQKEAAQIAGYTVVDHATIIATHLSELIRKHAAELIGRQELQTLVENLEKTHPKVVQELLPNTLPLGTVLKVCQNLLREQVPIRDILTIFETLANYGSSEKNVDALTEHVRASMGRSITHRLSNGSNELEVLTMDPRTEQVMIQCYQRLDSGGVLNLEPSFFEKLVQKIQETMEGTVFNSGHAVLLCNPLIRSQLRKALERFVPNLNIISAFEIAQNARVKSIGVVEV